MNSWISSSASSRRGAGLGAGGALPAHPLRPGAVGAAAGAALLVRRAARAGTPGAGSNNRVKSTKVFARLLQKAAESRGGASGRAPQSAECPYPHKSAGGGQGGDPRRGSPPIIVLIGAKSSPAFCKRRAKTFNYSLTSAGALPGGGRIQTSSGGPRGWGGCRPR